MDHLLCLVWVITALLASWLIFCQAQSITHLRDSRLLYPGTRLESLGRQQLWRPVYQRGGRQLDAFNSHYVGGEFNKLRSAQLHQPTTGVNRVFVQSLHPDTRMYQLQRDGLSYLIPKVMSSEVYREPSLLSVGSSARFEGPSYISMPNLATRSPQRFEKPSFLDPRNFRTPDMTLEQMEATLTDIEKHIKAKEMGNPDEYTGSRVLILLLREQCARLAQTGDPDLLQFCSKFDSRFRSFLF